MKLAFTVAATLSVGLLITGPGVGQAESQNKLPNLFPYQNRFGSSATFNAVGNGKIDLNGAFFQPLGNNGRSCFSCHRQDQGWSISAEGMQALFHQTQGLDPVFNTVDASNCGTVADTSTVAGRAEAYSLLLSRGLVRSTIGLGANAWQFEVVKVDNPYLPQGNSDMSCGHPEVTKGLALYRRPIPTTNLKFISAVQWDGRDSKLPIISGPTPVTSCPIGVPESLCMFMAGNLNLLWPGTLLSDLNGVTVSATAKRLGGVLDPADPRVEEITKFETNIYTAQSIDRTGRKLSAGAAQGGPEALASFPFYIGINDPFPGGNPSGAPFTSRIFTLYDAWAKKNDNGHNDEEGGNLRAQIVRGQSVFNNTVINITGVAGINDALGLETFKGACGTCHDSPNIGDHSVAAPLDIGVADPQGKNVLNAGYLPVYTLRNINPSDSANYGHEVTTTDPGRALISGKWADIGKFKGPILRALASRAPYFHNGLAQSLDDVVDFYDKRFKIGFTKQQHDDLVAFLASL